MMPLYRWNPDNLEPVPPTTFEAERLQEADLQRLLRDQPGVLEEGLFIIAEEFGNWQDSYRSIDLLGLDRTGRLVIIELKRTQSGDHSELQAIRYAAMVSIMTLEDVIEAHGGFLVRRGINEDARIRILNQLGVADEADAEIRTKDPRIILASAGFSKELTTSVLWLNDNGLDITCIRLRLYRNGDEIMMDTDQVMPLPESSDYLVKVREREAVERSQRRQGELVPGGGAFRETIASVPDESQALLMRLYQWATVLEQEGLCRLSTYFGAGLAEGETSLLARIEPERAGLICIYNYRGNTRNYPGNARIQFFRSVFERRAPNSISRVESLISPLQIRQGNWTGEIPDGLLDALTDAYREANGLPPTAPRPDTGPGSLAAAE
jgi:hypothetical protein